MAIWTITLFVVVESLTGQVVEPLVCGRTAGLSTGRYRGSRVVLDLALGTLGATAFDPLDAMSCRLCKAR
jgi:hypothetical protein